MATHYDTLGVPETATEEQQYKKAYDKLAEEDYDSWLKKNL